MWQEGFKIDGLTYIWYPITTGRHAFPVADRDRPHEDEITSYCGKRTTARELHGANELDWIRGDTCMDCWKILQNRD